MKKDKNLDELFRDKLLNYEQEPPAYLLENILAGVAGARRNRKIVFWRIAGVAAALLLAFVAGWQFNVRNGIDVKNDVILSEQTTPENSSELKTQSEVALPVETQKSTISQPATFNSSKNFVAENANSQSLNSKNTDSFIESNLVTSNDESVVMKPLSSIYRLIKPVTETKISLQKIKTKSSSTDQTEKSIDQQIMEQNQRLILTENQTKGKARWMVGAKVSPEYNVSRSSHSQVYASNMLSASSNPVDLGGGISVEYKKGKRWSLQSGVYYSGMGQSSGNSSYSGGKSNLFAGSDHGSGYFNTNVTLDASNTKMMMNSTAGVIEFKGIPQGIELSATPEDKTLTSNAVVVSNARFIQNFEYIEIPLYLRYTILDSRFDVEMLGGFSSNVLVGNETYMESSSGKSLVGSTKDMETLNYSGTLGIGLKYGLSKRVFLNIEPRVKYFLNSLSNNSSVTYKPYTIGVFTGLSYEF